MPDSRLTGYPTQFSGSQSPGNVSFSARNSASQLVEEVQQDYNAVSGLLPLLSRAAWIQKDRKAQSRNCLLFAGVSRLQIFQESVTPSTMGGLSNLGRAPLGKRTKKVQPIAREWLAISAIQSATGR